MKPELETCKQALEKRLDESIAALEPSRIQEAMGYALLGGGKRLRPLLLFAALEAYGLDPLKGLDMACGIEMMHTYSLIHDDMPEMDDDRMRRGKPCTHILFGTDVGLLAGDALQTLAFEMAAKAENPKDAAALCRLMAQKAGANGMCLGQDLDLWSSASDGESLEQLVRIETLKTGCLFQLPLGSAALIADHEEDLDAWDEIGRELGILFQVQDDLLEMTSTEEKMGKSLSDARNDKATALTQYGIDQATRKIEECYAKIDRTLDALGLQDQTLRALFDEIRHRTH